MKFERSSGILLHPSSFPNKFGIGDLGPEAFSFLDFLKEVGCKLWQILPLGPTGFGDSPYQSFSAFAGNPYLISPELMLQEGLLHSNDIVEDQNFSESRVEFNKIIPWKLQLLEKSYIKFSGNLFLHEDYAKFCSENEHWLDDYSLFMALKELFNGNPWTKFPGSLRTRDPFVINDFRKKLHSNIDRFKYYQFLFFRQWFSLKNYAQELDIKIIGDVPLYVAHDSADVWVNPDLFQLNSKGLPKVVAGVPPDYFSPTGQLWGNPIFNWKKHRESGYRWWIERVKQTLTMVDVIRLDHFRGFIGFWQVPAGNSTAENGEWVPGPGIELFEQLSKGLGISSEFPLIAEDLGVITADVIKLREHLDIPGMKILQFAFSGSENPFLPHHYKQDCVVYTGSHDNDTTLGWFNSAPEEEKKFAKDYMDVDGNNIVWDLIRLSWASVANFAIAPMQDILNLDSSSRMNFPGRIGGNWGWRMPRNYNQIELVERLKKINVTYGRC